MKINQLLHDVLSFQHQSATEPTAAIYDLLDIVYTHCDADFTVDVDEHYNIIIRKGNTKEQHNCIVAHYDQIHPYNEDFTLQFISDNVYAIDSKTIEQIGVGGDDKCGIYIALESLKRFENLTVVFFSDEEIGCVGSSLIDTSVFADCGMVIQCDRNGYFDVITHTNGVAVANDDFMLHINDLVRKYGFKRAMGTVTDVGELKARGITCPMLNISSGYYNAHADIEYINLSDLANTLAFVLELLERETTEEHHNFVFSDYGKYDDYMYYTPTTFIPDDNCLICGSVTCYDEIERANYCNSCGMYVDCDYSVEDGSYLTDDELRYYNYQKYSGTSKRKYTY